MSESEEGEFYVVERVVGKRRRGGIQEFLIKWKDYQEKTWEPAHNLQGIQLLIDLYEKERREGRQKSKEKPTPKDRKEKPIHKEQSSPQQMGRTAKKMSRKKIPRSTDSHLNDASFPLPAPTTPHSFHHSQVICIQDSDEQPPIQDNGNDKRKLRSAEQAQRELNRIVEITEIQRREGVWTVRAKLGSGLSRWVSRQQIRQSHPALLLQFYEYLWKSKRT